MEIVRAHLGRERFSEPMEKVKNPGFFELNFLPGAIDIRNPSTHGAIPADERRGHHEDDQGKENVQPHSGWSPSRMQVLS